MTRKIGDAVAQALVLVLNALSSDAGTPALDARLFGGRLLLSPQHLARLLRGALPPAVVPAAAGRLADILSRKGTKNMPRFSSTTPLSALFALEEVAFNKFVLDFVSDAGPQDKAPTRIRIEIASVGDLDKVPRARRVEFVSDLLQYRSIARRARSAVMPQAEIEAAVASAIDQMPAECRRSLTAEQRAEVAKLLTTAADAMRSTFAGDRPMVWVDNGRNELATRIAVQDAATGEILVEHVDTRPMATMH